MSLQETDNHQISGTANLNEKRRGADKAKNLNAVVSFTWAVALLITLGAPLALVGLGLFKAQSIDDQSIQGDRWVPAAKPASWPTYNVEAKVKLADAQTAVKAVVGMSGTVTGLPPVTPEQLVSGTYVMSINGIDLTAYSGSTPFFRPLSMGMKGADVQEFNRLLGSRGYAADTSDRWGSITDAGARQYLKDIGVQQEGNTEFQPSYIVWVPEEGVDLSGYQVALGQMVAAPTADVFTPRETIESISLDQQSELLRMAKAGWKIQYNEKSYDYSGNPTQIFKGQDAKAVPVPSGAETIRVEFSPNFGAGTISVPPSSVLEGGAGKHCLISRSPSGAVAVVVDVLGGEVGRTFVEPLKGESISEVLANPGTEKELLCKSD
ncbi:hypothetical protein SAMN04489743_1107 [Pseudarthrobacter equi]|uniref:Peptidoglycan binding domain-containing protein n=1 Tax=Pseudarthrobacter equi TaxID=728066 RepID=A0A1H1VTY6_9MICC|nr:hypothetical protein [Pseudarthrobacter equi]SDS88212.1 hypothetical protein SAMN04489743_1107 [Pseudarthrobacter equi]